MKKYFYFLAALSVAPTMALAQGLESDVDAELDQMYSSVQAAPVTAPVQAAALPAAPAGHSAGGQPIYILNQATPTSNAQLQQTQVQKQPTTIIEASPLGESSAERIRRSRQDAEVQTEQRIVEKLEQSRMEDEKKRANILFGDKFNQLNNNNEVQQAPVQQPVYTQPVQVQQVNEPKENTRDIIREELASALKVEEQLPQAPLETKYVAGILGIGDYPDTRQVRGNYALGVAFGTKYDNFIVEGSFLYSNYTVEGQGYYSGAYSTGYNYGYPYSNSYPYANNGVYIPDTIDVQQYSGSLAAKVQLFSGIIKPVFGGIVSYSYRGYSWDNKSYGYVNDTKANSSAIDIGALIGADLEFSPKYSLGLDYRYMWNLSSRVNGGNTWMSGPQYGTQLEKLQYYVMSLVGRVNF